MPEPLTPEERRLYADEGWCPTGPAGIVMARLWDAYQALEARVEEAERKQAIDQRQCDEMTSEAGRLAQRCSELEALVVELGGVGALPVEGEGSAVARLGARLAAAEAREKKLREAAALALEALDAGIPAPAVVALRWAMETKT